MLFIIIELVKMIGNIYAFYIVYYREEFSKAQCTWKN